MGIPLITRILIADDHAIVRSGLRKVLDAKPDLEVVAEAEDGAEAVDKALKENVDLAILDVSMPRMTGIQATAELQAQARVEDVDPVDARQRAVSVRGVESRCVGICAEVWRRHGHRRCLPCRHA